MNGNFKDFIGKYNLPRKHKIGQKAGKLEGQDAKNSEYCEVNRVKAFRLSSLPASKRTFLFHI
jgi:hypothetical protein